MKGGICTRVLSSNLASSCTAVQLDQDDCAVAVGAFAWAVVLHQGVYYMVLGPTEKRPSRGLPGSSILSVDLVVVTAARLHFPWTVEPPPHLHSDRTVCYATAFPDRKSGFRVGFRPDCSRESLNIGPPPGPSRPPKSMISGSLGWATPPPHLEL
jgi:hypothetical protein